MNLPLRTWVENTVNRVEAHWLSITENVPDAAVSKESHAYSVLEGEKTDHYWVCF